MLNREDKKFLRGVFSKYDYIMTTSQLKEEKLFYRDIQKLLNDGYIDKIKRGYYAWVEATTKTEVRIIKGMFPDAVLCMETALFYYRYSDRNPAEWSITIDKNVSRNRTSIDYPFVKAYRVEPPLVTLGETTGEIDYIKIRIYDRDRTICDILRNMNRMDKENNLLCLNPVLYPSLFHLIDLIAQNVNILPVVAGNQDQLSLLF